MDVKVFKTFIEVAKTRHFGKASKNLFITQAAVSARIRQLESFMNTPLFVRSRNNITLTSAGERLLPYAHTMIRALEQAKTDVALAEHQLAQLTIAAPANIWDVYLQNQLVKITCSLPNVAFKTESLAHQQLLQALHDQTLDVAIMFDSNTPEGVVSVKIAELEMVLVSTTQSTVEQALSNNYVYVDWGTRFMSEHANRHKYLPPPMLQTTTGKIATDIILSNGGSAYLPLSSITNELSQGKLFRVSKNEGIKRSIYFVYRANNKAEQLITTMLHVLKKEHG